MMPVCHDGEIYLFQLCSIDLKDSIEKTSVTWIFISVAFGAEKWLNESFDVQIDVAIATPRRLFWSNLCSWLFSYNLIFVSDLKKRQWAVGVCVVFLEDAFLTLQKSSTFLISACRRLNVSNFATFHRLAWTSLVFYSFFHIKITIWTTSEWSGVMILEPPASHQTCSFQVFSWQVEVFWCCC